MPPTEMTIEQLRLARMASQRLVRACADDAAPANRVLADVCGVQAQDHASAVLGVCVRRPGLSAEDVEWAIAEERSIVASWLMRGTLHLVATKDYAWMVGLFGPGLIRREQWRLRQLELSEATVERGVEAIAAALAERGPLTKAEIAEELVARGVEVDPKSQQPFHLLANAGARGLVCVGPRRGAKSTYASVAEWLGVDVPSEPMRESALATLARRYFAAFGPATVADLKAWSGLSAAEAKGAFAAIRDELREVSVDGGAMWLVPGSRAETCAPAKPTGEVVRLPSWDEYLLGYANRDFAMSSAMAKTVRPGGVSVKPAVLTDGMVTGVWKP